MSQPSPSVFRVNQSGEEQYDIDIEHIDTCPPPQSNPPPADGDQVIVAPESDVDEGSHSHGITSIVSKFKKTTAAVCFMVMGFCVVVAVALNGAAEHNHQQQQNALAAIKVVGGKAGKSFCEPAQAVTCGDVFEDEKVVLSDDLFCTDDVEGASNMVLRKLNAAITIKGPDAIIDCKGHTVRQMTTGSAPACEWSPGNSLDPSRDRKDMKENCDLYYQAGIMLEDGATAINCKVEQFYEGFLIVNGGEVTKSEASRNHRGFIIEDIDDSSTVSKISNVYAHGNTGGIVALVDDSDDQAVVSIENVLTEHNLLYGMRLRGQGITVKDATVRYNAEDGIRIAGESSAFPTKVQFEGNVISHSNKRYGIELDRGRGAPRDYYSEVNVAGVLSTYLNQFGLYVLGSSESEFTVLDGGSFNSCENFDSDVTNFANVNFVDSGTDGYTCDTVGGSGSGTPTCVACPACN